MGSTSFAVSMYLEAYNRMAPTIERAKQMLKSLGTTARQTTQQTSRLNPVNGWDKKIDVAIRKMREFGRESERIRKQGEHLLTSGFQDVAGATAIASPSFLALKYSADLQTIATTMEVGGFSREGIAKIKGQALELSKEMAFDWGQVMGVSLALQKAGMNESKVMNSQAVSTRYAQLEYNRYGSDPFQTATHLAHIAESAGVLYATATEREKHALDSQDKVDAFIVKKYSDMAEYLNRVVTVTSSDTARLAEAFKYSMPEGIKLGWSDKQVMMMTGVQSRFGIEGSMAGTHLKDFASRLNPFLHYVDEDAGKRSARLSAMMAAGWINDVAYTTTKAGHKKFYKVGESVFHDPAGNLKGPEEIFKRILESYKNFEAKGQVLQFQGILHDVFGEQGKDIIGLLTKNPEMIG
ncbi:MAG: phage tail tape measure protein, partial [Sporomusaceae bacterium]|nr:phage tail tape measure protein [Sporomusaceae bacterium]